ncbi:hypothetical protein L1887_02884 [Cichorium endivia]|nr:hypothetical protein L1887_02884 [Cichorium endivia]
MDSDANEKRASKIKEMMKKMEEEVANLKEAIYKNTTDVNASFGVIITMLGTQHDYLGYKQDSGVSGQGSDPNGIFYHGRLLEDA